MKQKGYQIAQGNGLGEIQQVVEKEQELRWVCQGGVWIESDEDDEWYYQAMILPAPVTSY